MMDHKKKLFQKIKGKKATTATLTRYIVRVNIHLVIQTGTPSVIALRQPA